MQWVFSLTSQFAEVFEPRVGEPLLLQSVMSDLTLKILTPIYK